MYFCKNGYVYAVRCVTVLILAEHSSGETLPSKRYNVILIGDSSVGKTSFMKRVETGKFSLDLPSSVGKTSVSISLKITFWLVNDEELNTPNVSCRNGFVYLVCARGW